MTGYNVFEGKRATIKKVAFAAAEQDLKSSARLYFWILQLVVHNATGGGLTATIKLTDGTDTYQLPAVACGAGEYTPVDLGGVPILIDDVTYMKVSGTGALDFYAYHVPFAK